MSQNRNWTPILHQGILNVYQSSKQLNAILTHPPQQSILLNYLSDSLLFDMLYLYC